MMTPCRGQQQQPSAAPLSIIDKMISLAANAATEEERIAATNAMSKIAAEQEKVRVQREKERGGACRSGMRRVSFGGRRSRSGEIRTVIEVLICAVGGGRGVCAMLILLWLAVIGLSLSLIRGEKCTFVTPPLRNV